MENVSTKETFELFGSAQKVSIISLFLDCHCANIRKPAIKRLFRPIEFLAIVVLKNETTISSLKYERKTTERVRKKI